MKNPQKEENISEIGVQFYLKVCYTMLVDRK